MAKRLGLNNPQITLTVNCIWRGRANASCVARSLYRYCRRECGCQHYRTYNSLPALSPVTTRLANNQHTLIATAPLENGAGLPLSHNGAHNTNRYPWGYAGPVSPRFLNQRHKCTLLFAVTASSEPSPSVHLTQHANDVSVLVNSCLCRLHPIRYWCKLFHQAPHTLHL